MADDTIITVMDRVEDSFSLAPGGDQRAAAEEWFCKEAYKVLREKFRGYGWMVEVDARHGVLKIRLNSHLMPSALWYVIRLTQIINGNDMEKAVMNGGGEILERYGLRTGRIHWPQWRDRIAAAPARLAANAKAPA